jgi:hypothetical protein
VFSDPLVDSLARGLIIERLMQTGLCQRHRLPSSKCSFSAPIAC